MEAKELRKGNIVQNDVLDIFKKGFINIEARHIFEIAVKESAQGYDNYVDFFKPIPLTEEWLLKFGGEKLPHFTVSNSIIIKTKRNQQLSFGCVGNPNFMVFIQEINDDDKITDLIAIHNWDYDGEMYVHQLQNLYFAITGEELEIHI